VSQQALDLRRSTQIVRRHKLMVGIAAALGIVGGAAYAVLEPPMLTSTAQIGLPASSSAQPAAAAGTGAAGGTDPFTATQEVVAGSYRVLLGALPGARPAMSLDDLRRDVRIASPAPDIISVTAKGRNAAEAEATANAVAGSYIRYVSSARIPAGRVQAYLLAPAVTATGSSRAGRMIVCALLGGLAGTLGGAIAALAIGRSDRRLRLRDEIANSIGVPVLASVPVARPSAAAGWMQLFEDYQPAAVHAWQLHTALRQLGMAGPGVGRPAYDDRAYLYDGEGGRLSLLVLSLSGDPGALALGPQLAAFAAAQGTPTALVIGPQQDPAAAATLRTACAVPPSEAPIRHGLLRVTAPDQGDVHPDPEAALVIVVAVVDGRAPEMPGTMRTDAAVMGVSAGAATAEQLARAAVAAAADDREITGILVADPEEADQTTGRVPRLAHPAPRRLPNRLRGIVTEIRR
jgi:capsular polysaccharide biosynthesis protein